MLVSTVIVICYNVFIIGSFIVIGTQSLVS